jgi:hypothetical protein
MAKNRVCSISLEKSPTNKPTNQTAVASTTTSKKNKSRVVERIFFPE